jgi:hypothetical protein
LTFASRTILAHFSISALICALNSSGMLPIGSNPRVGGRRSRVRIAAGVSEGRQAHVLSDPRDVGCTIEEIIGLGRPSWPFAWPVPQPAPYCSQVAARRPIFVYVRRQKIWKKPHGTQ